MSRKGNRYIDPFENQPVLVKAPILIGPGGRVIQPVLQANGLIPLVPQVAVPAVPIMGQMVGHPFLDDNGDVVQMDIFGQVHRANRGIHYIVPAGMNRPRPPSPPKIVHQTIHPNNLPNNQHTNSAVAINQFFSPSNANSNGYIYENRHEHRIRVYDEHGNPIVQHKSVSTEVANNPNMSNAYVQNKVTQRAFQPVSIQSSQTPQLSQSLVQQNSIVPVTQFGAGSRTSHRSSGVTTATVNGKTYNIHYCHDYVQIEKFVVNCGITEYWIDVSTRGGETFLEVWDYTGGVKGNRLRRVYLNNINFSVDQVY